MGMKTITATLGAWLQPHHNPGDLEGDATRAASILVYTYHDFSSDGWVRAGTAEITVTLSDDLVQNKIEALRESLKQQRAESFVKEQRIEQQIQNLLALEFNAEVPA